MILRLPQEKAEKIKALCKELLQKSLVTIMELNKLIEPLSSRAVAFLPAPLQYRAFSGKFRE